MIPGAKGENSTTGEDVYIDAYPNGGGAGVNSSPAQSFYGGGGNGGGPVAANMSNVLEPTAGGNGFILIEYAG